MLKFVQSFLTLLYLGCDIDIEDAQIYLTRIETMNSLWALASRVMVELTECSSFLTYVEIVGIYRAHLYLSEACA